ncbi:MAG: folate-binding protein YgfZ [Phycisphaerae bacterium]|nr:folate-binding protein YgfZ [Phycisphaerae bacterium]
MQRWTDFLKSQISSTGAAAIAEGESPVARFGALDEEYALLGSGPALVDRSNRTILSVRGADRASWLHNLTTNHVKTVGAGEGNYAFVLNVQGRILFDVGLLVGREEIRLDLDCRFLDTALRHLEKYTITEDVAIAAMGDECVRMALVGERTRELLAGEGLPQAANLAVWSHGEAKLCGVPVTLFRSDFSGAYAMELIVPVGKAVELWQWLTDGSRKMPAGPVGSEALDVRRIEAGVPWPGREIIEEYLPAETGQSRRAVSYNKGCYLGQEVVERMRSRGVVARRLCGLLVEPGDVLAAPQAILDEAGQTIGTMTSAARSPARPEIVALGYVRTVALGAEKVVMIGGGEGSQEHPRCARLAELPIA